MLWSKKSDYLKVLPPIYTELEGVTIRSLLQIENSVMNSCKFQGYRNLSDHSNRVTWGGGGFRIG